VATSGAAGAFDTATSGAAGVFETVTEKVPGAFGTATQAIGGAFETATDFVCFSPLSFLKFKRRKGRGADVVPLGPASSFAVLLARLAR
jgi:hypothetical protein